MTYPYPHPAPLVHQVRSADLDDGLLSRLLQITGLSTSVSDQLDARGLRMTVPAHVLAPLTSGQKVVGRAATLRYLPERHTSTHIRARGEAGRLGHKLFQQQTRSGDVAVVDAAGVLEASALGGISAQQAQDAGIAGYLIAGAVRDVDEIADLGLPVWCMGRTPVSGNRRLEAVEVNGPVNFCGVQVRPGDVAVADDSGIGFVPSELWEDVARAVLESVE